MRQVPSGLLPAMELDGELIIESADVMAALEYAFPDRPLMPAKGSPAHARATGLMKLERRLFGAWLQWLCYPRSGLCVGSSLPSISCLPPLCRSLDHLPVRHAGMLLQSSIAHALHRPLCPMDPKRRLVGACLQCCAALPEVMNAPFLDLLIRC